MARPIGEKSDLNTESVENGATSRNAGMFKVYNLLKLHWGGSLWTTWWKMKKVTCIIVHSQWISKKKYTRNITHLKKLRPWMQIVIFLWGVIFERQEKFQTLKYYWLLVWIVLFPTPLSSVEFMLKWFPQPYISQIGHTDHSPTISIYHQLLCYIFSLLSLKLSSILYNIYFWTGLQLLYFYFIFPLSCFWF